MVILINIEENKGLLMGNQKTDRSKSKAMNPCWGRHWPCEDHNADIYDENPARVITEEWLGPISVTKTVRVEWSDWLQKRATVSKMLYLTCMHLSACRILTNILKPSCQSPSPKNRHRSYTLMNRERWSWISINIANFSSRVMRTIRSKPQKEQLQVFPLVLNMSTLIVKYI